MINFIICFHKKKYWYWVYQLITHKPHIMDQSPPLSTIPAQEDSKQVVATATNFFTGISRFTEHADLTLTLRKLPDGWLAVSVLPKPTIDDQVKDQIAPFTLKASPSALDAGFFAHINQPLKQVSAFSVDLSAWEASQKKAELENQKTKKAKEEEEKRRKKSDVHLARAKELLEAEKYTEAVKEAKKAVDLTPTYEKATKQLTDIEEKANLHRQAGLFDTPNAAKERPASDSPDTPKPASEQKNVPSKTEEAPSSQRISDETAKDSVPIDTTTNPSEVASSLEKKSDTNNPLRTPRSYFN